MRYLCQVCGRPVAGESDYCVLHQELTPVPARERSWLSWAVAGVVSIVLLIGLGVLYGRNREMGQMVVVETVGPTVTPTVEPTMTITPLPTITPTPLPTETPLPPNKAALVQMTSDVAYIASALVDAEARGMGRAGMMLVACQVLREYWEVGGNWKLLTGRWSPLGRILSGAAFPQPSPLAQEIVRDANGTQVCRDYPECRFLGTPSDLSAWRSAGYISEGVTDARVYAGSHGQTLVCVLGAPELPTAPGK